MADAQSFEWNSSQAEAISSYIRGLWDSLVRQKLAHEQIDLPDIKPGELDILPLPHPYVIPAAAAFEAQFYWDSYFTICGLVRDGREELAWGMVENCFHMLETYGMIPNASATLWLHNVSQPPFLTSMVKLLPRYMEDDAALARAYCMAAQEYQTYWMAAHHQPLPHLNRWHSANDTIFWSEAESGWDFTPRFEDARRCIAVDLVALLYQYETDLAAWAERLNNGEAARWHEAAAKRREQADLHLWNEDDGLYYDYDYVHGRHRPVKSLAAYYPLWAGMASEDQTRRLVEHLAFFEHDYGLSACDRDYAEMPSYLEEDGKLLENPRKQWNYPNAWAPLHMLVVHGLLRYGYKADAERIAGRFCACIAKVYGETGQIWEKYNAVEGSFHTTGRYAVNPGFGWTNAAFQDFRALFADGQP